MTTEQKVQAGLDQYHRFIDALEVTGYSHKVNAGISVRDTTLEDICHEMPSPGSLGDSMPRQYVFDTADLLNQQLLRCKQLAVDVEKQIDVHLSFRKLYSEITSVLHYIDFISTGKDNTIGQFNSLRSIIEIQELIPEHKYSGFYLWETSTKENDDPFFISDKTFNDYFSDPKGYREKAHSDNLKYVQSSIDKGLLPNKYLDLINRQSESEYFIVKNDIQLLTAILETLALHNQRIRKCEYCGKIFFQKPAGHNKYCPDDGCAKLAKALREKNYRRTRIGEYRERTYQRIYNNHELHTIKQDTITLPYDDASLLSELKNYAMNNNKEKFIQKYSCAVNKAKQFFQNGDLSEEDIISWLSSFAFKERKASINRPTSQ